MGDDDPFPAAIVFDPGSAWTRAGFAGDDAPRAVFPAIVGHPSPGVELPQWMGKFRYIGDEAFSKRQYLDIACPIERGIATNFDDFSGLLHHSFYNELGIAPEEHPLLLAEPSWNPKANREKCLEIVFEEFNMPAVFLANQAVLALYASGFITGVVLEIGHGAANVVPAYQGYALQHAINKVELSGGDITDYLVKHLSNRGTVLASLEERETARDIKEKHCYVADDFEQELAARGGDLSKSVEVAGHGTVQLGSELFEGPEMLFRPSIIGREVDGIHEAVVNSILKCDESLNKAMFQNIVLAGGSTLLPGFGDRLRSEITRLVSPETKIHVVEPPERKYTPWIGGSILASLSTFPDMLIRTEAYKECGASIVHRMCF